MSKRYPENVPGPFYVERDLCLICMAPEHEAPDLMGYFAGGSAGVAASHCYFKKQPTTLAETERAINAMRVAYCGALRYGGDDQAIIDRLSAAGVDSDCIDARQA